MAGIISSYGTKLSSASNETLLKVIRALEDPGEWCVFCVVDGFLAVAVLEGRT